jgi:hypothetical protein
MVDMDTVHIGSLDQQHLHIAGSTNIVSTKDLANIDSIRDGVGSSGELKRMKATTVRVIVLGPPRWGEGKPRLVRLRVDRGQSF